MSETQNGTPASQINAAQNVVRTATASAINADANRPTNGTKPARKRSSNASKRASALAGPSKPAQSKPARVTRTPAQSKPAGPSETAQKRASAVLLCGIVGNAFGKLSDAQLKRAGITGTSDRSARDICGSVFASSLNYVNVPADTWNDNLPARKFTGGRGASARKTVPVVTPARKRTSKPAQSKPAQSKPAASPTATRNVA
jgi:hypothetical protein